jgi:hypothetical protein
LKEQHHSVWNCEQIAGADSDISMFAEKAIVDIYEMISDMALVPNCVYSIHFISPILICNPDLNVRHRIQYLVQPYSDCASHPWSLSSVLLEENEPAQQE